jgi:hypothetical protein
MAASVAAAALGPLALLLQWPARTATILFEVVMWVMGAPVAVCLGLLRYVGLLPHSPKRHIPAAAMYSSTGVTPEAAARAHADSHAQALVQVMAPSVRSAAAQAPAGALYTGSALPAPQRAPNSVSAASMVAGMGALPLLATVVPEEHEGVHVDDKVISPRGTAAVVRPVPPTSAPSMEVRQLPKCTSIIQVLACTQPCV